jgi:hypothetical protein
MPPAIAFQSAMRAAAVQLLTDYADDHQLKLQIYPGRPASIFPPSAFPDRMTERTTFTGPTLRQRLVSLELVVIHGLFDHKDTVAQRDAFVDGFSEYVADNRDAADPNSTLGAVTVADDPNYIPDWVRPELQKSYFATIVTLEGLALD